MLKFLSKFLAIAAVMLLSASMLLAAPVAITNHGFQDPVVTTDGNPDDEDPFDIGEGATFDAARVPPNWNLTYTQDDPGGGHFGLQRPDPDGHFTRDVTGGETSPFTLGGFEGDQIYFINLNNSPLDATGGSIAQLDSGVVGQLAAGTYTLTVAVGGRDTGSWSDLDYTVGLVGASSGPLGSTAATIDPGNAAGNSISSPWTTDEYNVVDVSFALNVPLASGLIGEDYFVRVTAANTGERAGVSQDGFTQAAIDNARLDFVAIPEPSSLVLLLGAVLFGMFVRRK